MEKIKLIKISKLIRHLYYILKIIKDILQQENKKDGKYRHQTRFKQFVSLV